MEHPGAVSLSHSNDRICQSNDRCDYRIPKRNDQESSRHWLTQLSCRSRSSRFLWCCCRFRRRAEYLFQETVLERQLAKLEAMDQLSKTQQQAVNEVRFDVKIETYRWRSTCRTRQWSILVRIDDDTSSNWNLVERVVFGEWRSVLYRRSHEKNRISERREQMLFSSRTDGRILSLFELELSVKLAGLSHCSDYTISKCSYCVALSLDLLLYSYTRCNWWTTRSVQNLCTKIYHRPKFFGDRSHLC